MAIQHRWAVGMATGGGLLGLVVSSTLVMLAHRFVEEFSHPHTLLDISELMHFGWEVPTAEAEPPLSLQRTLYFKTVDGTLLRGEFWAQPQPAPTVIFTHGYRTPSSYLRSAAALEYSYGYNIFLFDFRGHGESESIITSGGSVEVHDLEAALTVAGRQPEALPGKLIIHGFSMGAAVALLTPLRPDVIGIIADSPYARLDDILRRLVYYELTQVCDTKIPRLRPRLQALFPSISWIVIALSRLIFRLRFGFSFVARPKSSFKRWQRRAAKGMQQRPIPILLIHGVDDMLIPIDQAYQIAAEAKLHHIPLETYFVEGASHCGAYGKDPEHYVSLIQSFAKRCLAQ